MFNKRLLNELSDSGQLLKDFDGDVIEEVIIVTKMADLERHSSNILMLIDLDASLEIYKMSKPNTAIAHFGYRQHTQLFDIKIFREIVSLTSDDLKRLAKIPIV